MGSLNAGSELDNDTTDTPPEDFVLDDKEQMMAMEAAFVDLIGLIQEISSTGGMSRAFAAEAHRIMPELLSAKVAYFSENPTATRYKVSLEEIDKGVWALIIAGVAVVISAIYKIWKWLAGDDSEGEGTSKSASAGVAAKVDDVQTISEGTSKMADGMVTAGAELRANPIKYIDKDGKEVRWNSMDQLIEAVFVNDDRYGEEKKTLLNPHPIHYDIANSGPYSKLIGRMAQERVFDRVSTAIRNKIRLLEEIEHRDRNAQGQHVSGLQKQFDQINEPITVQFEGKTLTLLELAGRVREEREKAEATQVHRLHYDEMFHKIASAYKDKHLMELLKQMLEYMPVLEEMQAGLDRTERFAGDLSQDGQPGGNSPQVAQKVRALISVLHGQVTGFAALTNEINHYVHHFKTLSKTAEGFGKEIVRKVSHRMREAEVQEVPTEWKKVMAGIEASLEAMEKSHFPSGSRRRGLMGLLGRR